MRGRSGAALRVLLVSSPLILLSGIAAASSGSPGPQGMGARTDPGLGAEASLKELKAVEGLEPEALRRWPESFAGLWLEGRRIFVAFTERAERRVERLGDDFPQPTRLRAVTFDDSLAALRALQAQMIADRTSDPPTRGLDAGQAGFRQSPSPPEPRPPDPPPPDPPPPEPEPPQRRDYDLDIDVKRNVVVAIFEEPVTPELSAAFAQRYGEDVVVEQGVLADPLACLSRSECTPFLRGGLRTEGTTICSTAFDVVLSSGGETSDAIISAAHCGDPDADFLSNRSHAQSVYGQVTFEQQQGRLDVEVHSVGNGFFAFPPRVYLRPSQKDVPVFKVGTYEGLPIGSRVCKSGITTGLTCGDVLSKTYSPNASYLPDAHDFIKADFCGEGGDSGGSVFRAYRAIENPKIRLVAQGVMSGGAAGLGCDDPGDYSIFSHIDFFQQDFGMKVLTFPAS